MEIRSVTSERCVRSAIRAVHHVAATGAKHVRLHVFCAFREHAVDIEECRACPARREERASSAGGGGYLVCSGGRSGSSPRETNSRVSALEAAAPDVVCSAPDAPLVHVPAADLIVVVNDHGRPVGVITEEERRNARDGHRTAADVMNPLLVWLPASATVARAAALLAFERLEQLVLVSERERRVVGAISAHDVLRAFANENGFVIAPRASRELAVGDDDLANGDAQRNAS